MIRVQPSPFSRAEERFVDQFAAHGHHGHGLESKVGFVAEPVGGRDFPGHDYVCLWGFGVRGASGRGKGLELGEKGGMANFRCGCQSCRLRSIQVLELSTVVRVELEAGAGEIDTIRYDVTGGERNFRVFDTGSDADWALVHVLRNFQRLE